MRVMFDYERLAEAYDAISHYQKRAIVTDDLSPQAKRCVLKFEKAAPWAQTLCDDQKTPWERFYALAAFVPASREYVDQFQNEMTSRYFIETVNKAMASAMLAVSVSDFLAARFEDSGWNRAERETAKAFSGHAAALGGLMVRHAETLLYSGGRDQACFALAVVTRGALLRAVNLKGVEAVQAYGIDLDAVMKLRNKIRRSDPQFVLYDDHVKNDFFELTRGSGKSDKYREKFGVPNNWTGPRRPAPRNPATEAFDALAV